jgi:hypothetical protein
LFACRSRARWLHIFSIFIASLLGSGVAATATIPVELTKIVVDVYVANGQGKPIENGTGFFAVVKDVAKPDNAFGYLVTAKHVLQDDKDKYYAKVYVKLNKIKGGTELVQLQLSQNGKSWIFTLPDPAVDIAVIPALPSTAVYDFRAIPEEMIQSPKIFSTLQIGDGSEVFFVGAAQGYGGSDQASIPIARFGHISSYPTRTTVWRPDPGAPLRSSKMFLIEGQSFGDDAGAPVFLLPNPDDEIESFITETPLIKLAGVMVGNYNDTSSDKSATAFPTAQQNTNIEAVTPSAFLYQIIYSDDLKKMRAGPVEQAKK